jgi:hypothetical protein
MISRRSRRSCEAYRYRYGDVFERFALKSLQAGGVFSLRRLQLDDNGVESELMLEPSRLPLRTFQKASELDGVTTDRMLQPRSKSFCAVDFVFQGGRPANATVNKEHKLILHSMHNPSTGLFAVVDALKKPRPIDFYWIVVEGTCDPPPPP